MYQDEKAFSRTLVFTALIAVNANLQKGCRIQDPAPSYPTRNLPTDSHQKVSRPPNCTSLGKPRVPVIAPAVVTF